MKSRRGRKSKYINYQIVGVYEDIALLVPKGKSTYFEHAVKQYENAIELIGVQEKQIEGLCAYINQDCDQRIVIDEILRKVEFDYLEGNECEKIQTKNHEDDGTLEIGATPKNSSVGSSSDSFSDEHQLHIEIQSMSGIGDEESVFSDQNIVEASKIVEELFSVKDFGFVAVMDATNEVLMQVHKLDFLRTIENFILTVKNFQQIQFIILVLSMVVNGDQSQNHLKIFEILDKAICQAKIIAVTKEQNLWIQNHIDELKFQFVGNQFGENIDHFYSCPTEKVFDIDSFQYQIINLFALIVQIHINTFLVQFGGSGQILPQV
eukprot:TRINITY_DN17486_c1_g2_i2.p1 TRINITY_DN17486_c1_g2~~TRINITY_DN17486_c1_g2_i2.p1  ORF type:complete len:321 (+),score=47.73 TRINITY_DN17486_c1_g2_i2:249-1211(+)